MLDRSGLDRIKKNFKEYKASDFLLKNPKDKIIGLLSDNQRRFISDGINRVAEYFKKPKDPNIDQDWIMECPSEEFLEDCRDANVMKMTKFDALNAAILCENGLDQIKLTNLTDMSSSGSRKYSALFPERN